MAESFRRITVTRPKAERIRNLLQKELSEDAATLVSGGKMKELQERSQLVGEWDAIVADFDTPSRVTGEPAPETHNAARAAESAVDGSTKPAKGGAKEEKPR